MSRESDKRNLNSQGGGFVVVLPELTAKNAYIFRITHKNNLPWILDNGVHCRKSAIKDPNFVNIGIADLIEKRHVRQVTEAPGGTLSDYIPFYFTPLSMMAYNIYTGRNVLQRPNDQIVILVTSLLELRRKAYRFYFQIDTLLWSMQNFQPISATLIGLIGRFCKTAILAGTTTTSVRRADTKRKLWFMRRCQLTAFSMLLVATIAKRNGLRASCKNAV